MEAPETASGDAGPMDSKGVRIRSMKKSSPREEEIGSLLVITFYDYPSHHGRIHHIVAYLEDKIPEITVLHRLFPKAPGLWGKIKNLLFLSVRKYQDGGIDYIACEPFLNIPEKITERLYRVRSKTLTRGQKIRLKMKNVLNILTTPKAFALVMSFLLAFFLKIRKRYDLCIVQAPWEALVAHALKKLGYVETLIYDDIDYATGHIPSKLRRRYQNWEENKCISGADVVFTVGSLLADLRRRETGRAIHVIPNGVDHKLFRTAQTKADHPPTLVYVGRLSDDWGGIEFLLQAMRKLSADFPSLRLLMIGGGFASFIKKIKRDIQTFGLSEKVQLIGEIPYAELPDYLRQCDVGLACFKPSLVRTYCFPLKVVEYMAAGLAILGTRGTETEAILNRCECGISVDFEVDEIYRGAAQFFSNGSRLKAYQANAVKHSPSYDWDYLLEKEYRMIEAVHLKKSKASDANQEVTHG